MLLTLRVELSDAAVHLHVQVLVDMKELHDPGCSGSFLHAPKWIWQ